MIVGKSDLVCLSLVVGLICSVLNIDMMYNLLEIELSNVSNQETLGNDSRKWVAKDQMSAGQMSTSVKSVMPWGKTYTCPP